MSGNKTQKLANVKYMQRCNKHLRQMVTNIGFRCWAGQNKIDGFIRRVIREVKKSLEDKTTVSVNIIGHSYGGYVTSELVKSLKDHPDSHKLNIVTYGSIYVLDPKDYKGIRMKQYMNEGDVSLRCNIMSRKGIIWTNRKKKVRNVFDEWACHMDYPLDQMKQDIIKKLNS